MKSNRIFDSLIHGATAVAMLAVGGCAVALDGFGEDEVSSFALAGSDMTLFASSERPAVVDDGDARAVELGVRFRSDVAGTITGIRYYRSARNTGAHTGHLWSSEGKLLASATFARTTSTGWQTVSFAQPVAVQAGQTYIASYHTDVGHYAADTGYFTGKGKDSGPLHAPADAPSARNGVYRYGATAFPTSSYQGTNYWVDVVMKPATGGTTPPLADAGAPPPADAGTAPPPPVDAGTSPTPSPTTGAAFPLSWDDPAFANVVSSGPITVPNGQTRSNLSIVDDSGDSSVFFAGSGTINNVRMLTREGPRCVQGSMNLNWVWIDVYAKNGDHADGLQCYSPGSTGTVTVKNTTFYVGPDAHTGYFSADDWRGAHVFEDVLFWGHGGNFGLRIPADGGSSVSLKNVYFVKNTLNVPFQFDVVNGKHTPIVKWENVRWVTIENGKLVMGDPIPQP